MAFKFRTHQLTSSGNLSIKSRDLSRLGIRSASDVLVEFEVPGAAAILLMKLDPLSEIPARIQEILGIKQTTENAMSTAIETKPALVDEFSSALFSERE